MAQISIAQPRSSPGAQPTPIEDFSPVFSLARSGGLVVLLRHGTQMIRDALLLGRHVQHLVASVASQGRFPVATGLSLCLYLNCAPEAGKESSGSLGLFLAFAAGVAAVPPPSPDALPRGSRRLLFLPPRSMLRGVGGRTGHASAEGCRKSWTSRCSRSPESTSCCLLCHHLHTMS